MTTRTSRAHAISNHGSASLEWRRKKVELAVGLIRNLYNERLLQTWLRDRPEGWELVSGRWSPFYISMRNVPSRPELFHLVVEAAVGLLAHEVPNVNRVIGLAATGIPIAAALGYVRGLPMGFTRKLPGVRTLADLQRLSTNYGGHSLVEGDFQPGDRLVVFDDVVSSFDSKEVAIKQIEMELACRGIRDVRIEAVAALVDRGHETKKLASTSGFQLVTLVELVSEGLDFLHGQADPREIDIIRDYILRPGDYQAAAVQSRLTEEAVLRRSLGSDPPL